MSKGSPVFSQEGWSLMEQDKLGVLGNQGLLGGH